MNIQDIGTMFGMIVVSLGGYTQYADSLYVNHDEPAPYGDVYVELAAQNPNLLYDAEDELAQLLADAERDQCDAECLQRIATLKERIRNLKK